MGRGQAVELDEVQRYALSGVISGPANAIEAAEQRILSRLQAKHGVSGRSALAKQMKLKLGPVNQLLDGDYPHLDVAYAIEETAGLDAPLLTVLFYLGRLKKNRTGRRGPVGSDITHRLQLALRELNGRGLPWDQPAAMLSAYLYGQLSEEERDAEIAKLWQIEERRLDESFPVLPPSYVSPADSLRGYIRGRAKARGVETTKELATAAGVQTAQARLIMFGFDTAPQLVNFEQLKAVCSWLGLPSASRAWAVLASETLPIVAREQNQTSLTRISSINGRQTWARQLSLLKAVGESAATIAEIDLMIKKPVDGCRSQWEIPFWLLLDTLKKDAAKAASA